MLHLLTRVGKFLDLEFQQILRFFFSNENQTQ